MSTTLTLLPFQRFIRQVVSGPSAVIAAASLAEVNAIALQSADWQPVPELGSAMPPLNMVTNPLLPTYDAFKYGSDYEAGQRNAYAGMVAYRFQTPADALAGATHESDLTSIAVSLHVDRWLIGGARVAAYVSDDETPSTDWSDLREGAVFDDAVLPATDPRADQNATVTLPFPAETAALKYIWVILSLEDYPSVSPLDVRRIEGGALLVGQSVSAVFAEDSVAADTVISTDWLGDISYTSTAGNADLAVQITGAALENQGLAGDITRANILADSGLQRYLWGSMLDSFDHLATYAAGASSYPKILAVAGGTDDLYAVPSLISSIHTRHIRPHKDGTYTGLRFVQAGATVQGFDYEWSVPAPMEALVGRVSVYFLAGALFPSSSRIGYAAAPDYAPAATAAARRDFWLGAAASISEWTGSAAVDHEAICLLTTEVDGKYPLNHIFPISQSLTSDGVLVVALIISRVKAPLANLAGGSVNEWPWPFGQIELIQ